MNKTNALSAGMTFFLLFFISVNVSRAQTNFFYYQGEKVILNVKNTQLSIIFSESTTKSNAADLLSRYDIAGELEQVRNVALPAFYTVKFDEPRDIGNTISNLKSEGDIIWANPVFERNGTEFKVYNRFVVKLTSLVSREQIDSLNQKHHVKLIRESGTGRYTFELGDQADLPVMDMSNLYYKELNADWAMPDFIVPFEFYGNPSDFYFSYQWNYSQANDHDIDAPEAWDISTGSSDIIVAVVDNGVMAHPDLPAARIVEGYDAVNLLPSSDPDANVEPNKNEAHGMACAGKDGLFRTKRSINTEAEWQYLGLGDLQVVEPGTFGVIDVVVLNDTIVAGVSVGSDQFQTSGIYRSVDDGNSWAPSDSGFVGSSGVVLKLAQSLSNPRMLAAGCIFGPKVYISKNFWISWIPVFNFAPDAEAVFSTLGFSPHLPNEIWAGGAVVPIYSNPILFRSTDFGEKRNDVLNRPRDPNLFEKVNDIAFDSEDEQTVYVCMNYVILKTTDSGNNWTPSDTLRSPLHSLSLDPSDNQEFIAGALDTLYHSLRWYAILVYVGNNS